jgi:hypothetical protein
MGTPIACLVEGSEQARTVGSADVLLDCFETVEPLSPEYASSLQCISLFLEEFNVDLIS